MQFFGEHASLTWLILGILMIAAELVLFPGGFILIFFGLGAIAVSLLEYFYPLSIWMQGGLFFLASIMFILLLRENLQRLLKVNLKDDPENEFIGKTGKAVSSISLTEGKVEFKGTTWPAISEELILPGQEVEIVEQESILLHVKPLK